MTCVLAAVGSEVRPRISAILRGWEVRFVDSGSELAKALADQTWDMVLLEVHFNRHAVAAALRCILSGDPALPVVCVRHAPFAARGHAGLDALRVALGAHVFLDLLEHADDDAGNAAARTLIERVLADSATEEALLEVLGGADGTRTRDPRRDRPVF